MSYCDPGPSRVNPLSGLDPATNAAVASVGGVDECGGIDIRKAAAEDLAELERVLPSGGDHARQLANAAAGRRTFLLARRGEELLGTVVVRWTGRPVGGLGALPEIGSLEVVPQRRRQGVGRQLVAAAEARVLERGGTAAAIRVAQDNHGARRLYERLGYRDSGHREHLRSSNGGVLPELVLLRELVPAP